MGNEKTRDVLTPVSCDTGGTSLIAVPVPKMDRSTKRNKRVAVATLAFVGLFLALMWWGFGGGSAIPSSSVEILAPGPVERVLAVSGRTATDISSNIVPSVSARVLSVHVNEGDLVKAGDLLLVLDNTSQRSSVKQVMAALDAGILLQQSAQADRDRAVALGATESQVALANAEQALELAKSEVNRLTAAFDQAQIALRDFQIMAPISGVVLSRSVEAGDLVGPSNVLMRLANTDNLHVEVQIDEIYADEIRVGQSAKLQLAGQDEVVDGVVSFVASEVDELTGSLRIKLSFNTPPKAQIGLTTVANILIDEVTDVLTVPRSAFVESDDGAAVFVLRDGKAHLVPITYIDWPADRVQVTSGLSAGDKLVLSTEGVTDGQQLSVTDSSTAGD